MIKSKDKITNFSDASGDSINKMNACYIWDEQLIEQCDRLPAVVGRASMVHNLIEAYGLISKIKVVRSSQASYKDMREFHSELYLDHLKRFTEVDEDFMTSAQDEEFGIGYDCPPVSNMYELVSCIAGSSITAARCLMLGVADVAINWCGGWHHAHRFGAEGFCYVNDIVIAIEKLKKKFPKVLYIDLDVHHGNGVQDAYSISKSVFTLSFHKYEPGFYPGTGGIDDIGSFGGTGYSCNVPLHAAYSDDTMEFVFEKVFSLVYNYFAPDAIITQCGADALAHDPNGGAKLTARSYCNCVRMVLNKQKPTILMGGGGYKHPNAARLWTSLTAMVAGVELDEQIPEHKHWPDYGPTYTLPVEPTLEKDSNKNAYIEDCINKIKANLEQHLGNSGTLEPLAKKMKTLSDNLNAEDNHTKKKILSTVEQSKLEPQKNISNKTVDVYDFVE
ncbi:histone deacetylase 8-like [Anticarsia gemmatalis]|uniref:histone deacetylase 8-like n=1 Tax=Anticarsia gemmatalis TaxID=129554 RepID=UPI003F7719E3